MEWTSLISATFFDGIKADLLVAVSGITMLVLITAGAGILWRVFR